MYLQTVTPIYEWLWVLDSLHCYDVSTGIATLILKLKVNVPLTWMYFL